MLDQAEKVPYTGSVARPVDSSPRIHKTSQIDYVFKLEIWDV